MNRFTFCLFCIGAATLSACSSATTTAAIGSAQNAAGSYTAGDYSVTQNGTTIALGATTTASRGFGQWYGFSPETHEGYVYENADVIAVAVMDEATNATVAGMTGTPVASVPTSGTASYTGNYGVTFVNSTTLTPKNMYGTLISTVDFATGDVTGVGTGVRRSQLTYSASIAGTTFSGTAQFSAERYAGTDPIPLIGGFYSTNELVGVLPDDGIAGVFYGIAP